MMKQWAVDKQVSLSAAVVDYRGTSLIRYVVQGCLADKKRCRCGASTRQTRRSKRVVQTPDETPEAIPLQHGGAGRMAVREGAGDRLVTRGGAQDCLGGFEEGLECLDTPRSVLLGGARGG